MRVKSRARKDFERQVLDLAFVYLVIGILDDSNRAEVVLNQCGNKAQAKIPKCPALRASTSTMPPCMLAVSPTTNCLRLNRPH